MKTSILKITNVPFLIALLFVCGTGFGQKSVNYPSVSSQLEEITTFLDVSCKKVDKISTEIITDLDMFVKKNTNSVTAAKITYWSEVQFKELNGAVQETKIWFSKQHFAPIKLSRTPNKVIAKK